MKTLTQTVLGLVLLLSTSTAFAKEIPAKQIVLSGSAKIKSSDLAVRFYKQLATKNLDLKKVRETKIKEVQENLGYTVEQSLQYAELKTLEVGSDFYLGGTSDEKLNCGDTLPSWYNDNIVVVENAEHKRTTQAAIAARINVHVAYCEEDETAKLPKNAKTIVTLRFEGFVKSKVVESLSYDVE